jgi:hypothetical protein
MRLWLGRGQDAEMAMVCGMICSAVDWSDGGSAGQGRRWEPKMTPKKYFFPGEEHAFQPTKKITTQQSLASTLLLFVTRGMNYSTSKYVAGI